MAALIRGTEATYEVHETIRVDTIDNSDHTFCGVMFPVKCKAILPLDHIVIRSVAVRGQLGPLTVWVSNEKNNNNNNTKGDNNNNNNNNNSISRNTNTNNTDTNNTNTNNSNNNRSTSSFRLVQKDWTKVYERNHEPSMNEYQDLELDPPIILQPGEVRAIYIHSMLPGDEAIVYDNAYYYLPRIGGQYHDRHYARKPRYDDAMISIFTGRAHVSNQPFGHRPIWGWGNAWRDQREFVGRLEYGAVYKLWHPEPETRLQFGPKFSQYSRLLLMCQRRWESPISMLPDECLFYVLHMCRWDWFNDTQEGMKRYQYGRKKKIREKKKVAAIAAAITVDAAAQPDLNHQNNNGDAVNCASAAAGTTNNNNICNKSNCKSTPDDATAAVAADVSMQLVDLDQATDATLAAGTTVDDDEGNSDMEDDDYSDVDGDEDDDIEFIDGDEDDDVDFDVVEDYDDGDDIVEVDDDGMFIADHQIFRFVDFDDDDDDDEQNNNNDNGTGGGDDANFIRDALFHRQFARIHILRALAAQGGEEG